MFGRKLIQAKTQLFHTPIRQFAAKKTIVDDILKDFRLMVGFEIHAQMKTRQKLFSPSHVSQLAGANEHCDGIDLAFPGVLPVLNADCLNKAIYCSLALNGTIPDLMKFDRKHYFYADLPQGYQITQKNEPVMKNGILKYFNRFDEPTELRLERI